MNTPENLPRLAVGSHSSGSGKACVMNAVSYLNGDTRITDMPDCAYPLLSRIALKINDTICTHRDGDLLCNECSHDMWMLGARIIGTASAVDGWTDEQKRVLNVRMAVHAARQVQHLMRDEDRGDCDRAVDAAQAWAEDPSDANKRAAAVAVADAYAAAHAVAAVAADAPAVAAAYAAAHAVAAAAAYARAAVADADADAVADAVAVAADAVAADAGTAAVAVAADAAHGNAKLTIAHAVIDEFERLTGHRSNRDFDRADYDTVRELARLESK